MANLLVANVIEKDNNGNIQESVVKIYLEDAIIQDFQEKNLLPPDTLITNSQFYSQEFDNINEEP